MFRVAASESPKSLRLLGLAAVVCSALTLVGCGGGSRAKEYAPQRLVAFGDENSLIETYSSASLNPAGSSEKAVQGLAYTMNSVVLTDRLHCTDLTATTACVSASALTDSVTDFDGHPITTSHSYYFDATNSGVLENILTRVEIGQGTVASTLTPLKRSTNVIYACASSTNWVQVVAHAFNLGFASLCPLDRVGAETYAAYGATVQTVAAQVSSNMNRLGDGTLVTIMAGQHDVLELFALVKAQTLSLADAQAQLQVRAGALAEVVRSIIRTDAKVLLALTPDLSESPYPVAQGLTEGERQSLKALVKAFNERLYIRELGNESGRSLAGINPDAFLNPTTRSTSYNYADTSCDFTKVLRPDGSTIGSGDADYTRRVRYCTNEALRSTSAIYMWADETHLTPTGHNLIGSSAFSRAANQF